MVRAEVRPATAAASPKPNVAPAGLTAPNRLLKRSGAASETKVAAPGTSAPTEKPCTRRSRISRTVAVMPIDASVGSAPIRVVATPMSRIVATSTLPRSMRFPTSPNAIPPSGRARYAVANTTRVSNNETTGSSLGKNSGAMNTDR